MTGIAPRRAGFTLFEMLLATGLIALVVSLVLSDGGAAADARLDLAAQRVAEALRIARTEAMRSEKFLRVTVNVSGGLTVHELDAQSTPPQLVQLARNPVSRQEIDFDLTNDVMTRGVRVSAVGFDFLVAGTKSVVDFGPSGMPMYLDTNGNHRVMNSGSVTLDFEGRQRVVAVLTQTGRVTIQ